MNQRTVFRISERASAPLSTTPSTSNTFSFQPAITYTSCSARSSGDRPYPDDIPEPVRFWASPDDAPYIKTKPIHCSQKTIESQEDGSAVFEVNVIINPELVRLLLGFAEGVKILVPKKLRHMMEKHLRLGLENYTK